MRTFGIERERFISNAQGQIVSAIGKLLPRTHKIAHERRVPEDLFGFELFAGQIEDRTLPCYDIVSLREALVANDDMLLGAASELGLIFDHSEFVEEERVVAFEVNPFDERHQKIWASLSHERRVAASVVASIHIHISVSGEEAVRILNLCRKNTVEHLISVGDHSGFRRINAYRTMAETDGIPPTFSGFSEVMSYITSKGGEKDVWDLVRFKPSTDTVEFRMFGATPSIDEIIGYVNACRDISEI